MLNPKSQISNPKQARRGGTYIIVLGSALILSTLGTMALLQQRIQRKGFAATAKTEQARLSTESALRLGLLDIHGDPAWRDTYAAEGGEVLRISSSELGDVVVTAKDPFDDVLDDDENDPVVLEATATLGQTTQRAEAVLYPTRIPPEVLWKGVVAGDDMTAGSAIVRSDRPLLCDAMALSSAAMYADVEAVSFSGSTYYAGQTQIANEDRPALPGLDSIVSEYVSRGTTISISDIPNRTPNLLKNPGIESGAGDGQAADHWLPSPVPPDTATCDIEQEDGPDNSGVYSLYVKNRSAASAGPLQDCTNWVKPNATYYVEAYVYIPDGLLGLLSFPDFTFTWYTDGSSSSSTSASLLDLGSWKKITATMQAGSWSGDLDSGYIKVATASNDVEFYLDDVLIQEINRRSLYRRVLSPASNPFGSTNPDGIYVIDCNGSDLVIERCRILGTLVILNPGPNSAIEGPISWEPAKAGYPSLIVGSTGVASADMTIRTTRKGLIEARELTNFNPSGTPHDAVGTDKDQKDDTLPSEIRGWMYVGNDLTLSHAPTIHGVVLVGDDIRFYGAPKIHWDPAPILHPPPGLEGSIELQPRTRARNKTVQ